MKILLANKFYYRRGGDCIYMLNLKQLLQAHGHETAVFAMQYPENLPSKWSGYFPSEVKFTPGTGMLEAFRRPFGTKEVKRKFSALLDDFQPDIVHLNNIHTQLSPIIAELAHQRGIKVVWTLHDYKLLCPRYDCLRQGTTTCEACFTDKHQVLKHRCMKQSRIASWLAYQEAIKWNRDRLEACTDVFICPSRFMAEKMAQGGFDKNKLKVLCNFIDTEKCQKEEYNKENYYCYIGRLSHEKGVQTLIKAANDIPQRLVIIGSGPLEQELKGQAAAHIRFAGFKGWEEIKELIGKARFTIIPSEWYENNPLSVIEAQCLGTPVLGARIGGIPELIKENESGLCYESRNVTDLREKITQIYTTPWDYAQIAATATQQYNAENYYQQLIKLYTQIR